jgi:hypothetical protein
MRRMWAVLAASIWIFAAEAEEFTIELHRRDLRLEVITIPKKQASIWDP